MVSGTAMPRPELTPSFIEQISLRTYLVLSPARCWGYNGESKNQMGPLQLPVYTNERLITKELSALWCVLRVGQVQAMRECVVCREFKNSNKTDGKLVCFLLSP